MNKKILVAYFSATGATAKVAKKLAEAADADLFEIRPEIPYTSADLNWMDKNSRSSVEMNNPSSRPAVDGKVPNMEAYDAIFVGFPEKMGGGFETVILPAAYMKKRRGFCRADIFDISTACPNPV